MVDCVAVLVVFVTTIDASCIYKQHTKSHQVSQFPIQLIVVVVVVVVMESDTAPGAQ